MKTGYVKLPGTLRRRFVTVVAEYDNPPSLAVRLQNGEEWKIAREHLLLSAMEEIAMRKTKLREDVINSVREFLASGKSYEEARNQTGDKFGLTAKSVGRYYKAWLAQNKA